MRAVLGEREGGRSRAKMLMVMNIFAAMRESPEKAAAAASGAGLLLKTLRQEAQKSNASLDGLEPDSVGKGCAGERAQSGKA